MQSEARSASTLRRVAILAPMPSELRPLMTPLSLDRSAESERLSGSVGEIEVVASLTGIGLRAGAEAAASVIEATSPDHLVVVGIAGGIGASVGIGDLVVPELVWNLDTDETFRPTRFGGQIARGILASSDALLEAPREAEKLKERGVIAIDMETAAIASVCDRLDCPWSVFRGVSDRADDGTTDAAILGLTDSKGHPKPAAVVRFLLTQPQRIPQLVRLARGSRVAAGAAAAAAVSALESLRSPPASLDASRMGDLVE